MVRYILGRMLGVEALLLLLPAFVGILYGEEKEALTFVIPAVILTCIFVIAGRKRPEGQVIYGKEGMVVVASFDDGNSKAIRGYTYTPTSALGKDDRPS